MVSRMYHPALVISFRPVVFFLTLSLLLSMLPITRTMPPYQHVFSLPAAPVTDTPAVTVPAPPALTTPQTPSSERTIPPLAFVANAGQTSSDVQFQVSSLGGSVFFTTGAIVLSLPATTPVAENTDNLYTIVQMQFQGSNPLAQVRGGERLPGVVNDLRGNDPAQWHTNIPTYRGITYQQLYPGIDLYYDGTGGTLKGTYTVAPHANPSRIRWHYNGASAPQLDQTNGSLNVAIPGAAEPLVETAPVAWQVINGQSVPVDVRYALYQNGSIGFAPGAYNPSYPLIIDPALTYSTYIGGSASEDATGVAVDEETGVVYITGSTDSINFPQVEPLPVDLYGEPTVVTGTRDIFVMKLSAFDNTLLYSTYIGGHRTDIATAIALDSDSNAYITGYTQSAIVSGDKGSSFPIVPADAYQTTKTLDDEGSFALKLSSSGNRILYSTFLDGSSRDRGYGIATWEDTTGDVYAHIVGYTTSSNFPTSNPIVGEGTKAGPTDIFYTLLNPDGRSAKYSTFIGGADEEEAHGIAVGTDGTAYITGQTNSDGQATDPTGLLTATATLIPSGASPVVNNLKGSTDAFVMKVWETPTSVLTYSTIFLGSSLADVGNDIAVDSSNNIYVIGTTEENDFPLTVTGTEQAYSSQSDIFMTILAADGQNLLYSTYLGNGGEDSGQAIALDASGRIYLTGNSDSGDYPEVVTPPQLATSGGSTDAFITILDSDKDMVFSTANLGGNSDADQANDIAVMGSGEKSYAFVVGYTNSSNFPISGNAMKRNAQGTEAFFSKIGPPEITNGADGAPQYMVESVDGQTLRIRVQLSTLSSTPTTLSYRVGPCTDDPFLANEKATADDVDFKEGEITIPANTTDYSFDITDIYPGNTIPDPNKEFCVYLANGAVKVNGEEQENSVKYVVLNDDPVDVIIKPADEPLAGTDIVTQTVIEPQTVGSFEDIPLMVYLRQTSYQTVTVPIHATDMGTSGGIDYELQTGSVVFAPGETEQPATVRVYYDNVKELDEVFAATIGTPIPIIYQTIDGFIYNQVTGQKGEPGETRVLIEDPTPPRTVSFVSAETSSEGETNTTIALKMDGKCSLPVQVQVDVTAGTAILDLDFRTPDDSTVTFAPGIVDATLTVPINQDWFVESDESINLSLASIVESDPPVNMAVLGSPAQATLWIRDDEQIRLPIIVSSVVTSTMTSTVRLGR